MERLIDAINFQQQIVGMAIINNYQAEKANALCALIDAQPTAYDMDKVVSQMREKTLFLKDCKKYGGSLKSYDTMMMYEVAELIDELIETVKAGRISG